MDTGIYIPIWLYSNPLITPADNQDDGVYIPIWLYSNFSTARTNTNTCYVYIPIWLYSNHSGYKTHSSTFYVYIPIWLYSNDVGNIITNGGSGFTFQYGYIQMLMNRQMQMQQMSLHSNMVIFKWTDSRQRRRMREVYIPIWLYSNKKRIELFKDLE